MAAFAVLATLGLLSWPRRSARVLVGLLLYGVLIEVLQGFTAYRQADALDVVADAVGLALGVAVVMLVRRRVRSGGETRSQEDPPA